MIVGTPYITTRHYVVSEAAIDKTETLKLVTSFSSTNWQFSQISLQKIVREC